ncbi:MAG: helix-turn-helix domain-containing protein [Blastocatellia bacterium]
MLNTTKINGKRTAKAHLDAKAYAGLLAETLPTVITTVAQNRRMIKTVQSLMRKGKDRTPEEIELQKLLGHLICDFERKYYKPRKVTPREALIGMMEMNGLKQADVVHVFGSSGVTSEVISGKREISKANAKALAKFFTRQPTFFREDQMNLQLRQRFLNAVPPNSPTRPIE